jgi:hypothetical protein
VDSHSTRPHRRDHRKKEIERDRESRNNKGDHSSSLQRRGGGRGQHRTIRRADNKRGRKFQIYLAYLEDLTTEKILLHRKQPKSTTQNKSYYTQSLSQWIPIIISLHNFPLSSHLQKYPLSYTHHHLHRENRSCSERGVVLIVT